MKSSRITTDIARAAAQAAKEKKCADELLSGLKTLGQVFEQTPELMSALSDPTISLENRVKALRKAAGDQIHEYAINAAALLMQHDQLENFSDFLEQAEVAAREIAEHHECKVTTAVALESEIKRKLHSILEKKLGGTVTLATEIDPSILGGMIITCGDWRFVSTIQSKLQQLTKHLVTT